MPTSVIVLLLISLVSCLYSMDALRYELHQKHGFQHMLRVGLAGTLTGASVLAVLLSATLLWLAVRPALIG